VILFLVIRAQLWSVREGKTERWGKWNLIPAGGNDHEQADSGRDRSRDGDREREGDRQRQRETERETEREVGMSKETQRSGDLRSLSFHHFNELQNTVSR
jgi:hypothetical protein